MHTELCCRKAAPTNSSIQNNSTKENGETLVQKPLQTEEMFNLLSTASKRVRKEWDLFFHTNTNDYGCKVGGIIRIMFSTLAFSNFLLLGLDIDHLLSPSNGAIVFEDLGRNQRRRFTVFNILPNTDIVLWIVYATLMTQIIMLGIGVFPRFQILCILFWFVSFHNHNNLIWNGEDSVFQFLAFFMIFLPLHKFTVFEVFNWNKKKQPNKMTSTWPMWPFRLLQIQMCLGFFSCFLAKIKGNTWRDGTALYYITYLDFFYGKVCNPNLLFGYMLPIKALTWGTLVIEGLSPFLIWFESFRKIVLFNIILFHLGIDLSMNLNFFQLIMIVAWLSFLVQPATADDLSSPGGGLHNKKLQ